MILINSVTKKKMYRVLVRLHIKVCSLNEIVDPKLNLNLCAQSSERTASGILYDAN